MNPLYIALPLFVAFMWIVAWAAVRHDRKVLGLDGRPSEKMHTQQ